MALARKFDHDIFVSYAQVDNRPAFGVADGWVTTLIENLKIRLSQLFGRDDRFSIWWDVELEKYVDLTPAILEKVGKTRLLLIILSPAYLESDWCRRERNAFLELIRERGGDTSCLFVVHRELIDRERVPKEIHDKLGYHFYVERSGKGLRILGEPKPNPDMDRDYYDKIGDLARGLHRGIVAARLRDQPDAPPAEAGPAETGPAKAGPAEAGPAEADAAEEGPAEAASSPCTSRRMIYLAEGSEDLDPLRDEVVRYLDQFGYGVLPETWYSRKGDEFETSLKVDLDRSLMFVQLLGDQPGRRLQGSTESYPRLQHRCAAATGKPILQWRDRALDLDAIRKRNADHAQFLESSTVQAVDLEAFKKAVVDAAAREVERLARPGRREDDELGVGAVVFVNNDPEDLKIAEQISEALSNQGILAVFPIPGERPDEVRRNREQRLLECEGVIVVYGNAPPTWVQQQVIDVFKIRHKRRENPIRAVAVAISPPEPKSTYGAKMPDMHEIDCRHEIGHAQFDQFIAKLAGNAIA